MTSILVLASAGADESIALKKAMLADWNESTSLVKSMRFGQIREYYRSISGKPLRFERRDRVALAFSPAGSVGSYDIESYDEQMKVKERRSEMELVNSQYKAMLQKGQEKNSWLLTKLIQPTPTEAIDFRSSVFPWLVCGNLFLPDLIADARFRIDRIDKPADAASPDHVRVFFIYDEMQKNVSRPPLNQGVRSGHLDIDRSRRHCVLSYRYERKTRFSESVEYGSFQYDNMDTGIPLLKKVTVEIPEFRSERFGAQKSRETFTYNITYRATIPDEEFRLSHYGLPEPMGVSWKQSIPTYLWLFLGAGGSAGLALCFRYLARRTPKAV
jgi:hypothetical protein